ncbi:sensor histidine kinase [Flexivirga caeni]|uniref:sensor histidine kinase n=1 Tax=Flexivirga caeni TaxID=2294115 RepID=UPI00131556DC|nr:histidine kinase [Flexivirga caeni]
MRPSIARAATAAAAAAQGLCIVIVLVAREREILHGSVADLAVAVAGLASVGGGVMLTRRVPASAVGPALAWCGGSTSSCTILETVADSSGRADPLPFAGPLGPLVNSVWPVQFAGLLMLLLVFPAGRMSCRLWPVPALFAAGTAAVAAGNYGTGRTPDGGASPAVDGPHLALALAGSLVVGLAMAFAAGAVTVRYRRGPAVVRRQVRWLILGGGTVLSLLVAGWILQAFGAGLDAAYTGFIVAQVVLIPVAVTIAVVRHELYDVDRLLSSSTAWALTLLLSAAVSGGVVVLGSELLHGRTRIGVGVASFATALALLPLQRFLNRALGQLVDPDRHVALAAVESFAAAVSAGRREPEEIQQVLRAAQSDPGLQLLLRTTAGRWVGVDGRPVTAGPRGLDLESRGAVVARLELAHDSARSRRRAADLVRAARVPIEVTRLRLDLRAALAEARASRSRLAAAGAHERQRLERDLHDGAQQRILAVGMRLRSVQQQLSGEAWAELDRAVSDLEGTVAELRRLARGLRPSRLDDGLAAALQQVRASSPLPVRLSIADLPDLDETRAQTAYLVVAESVANVLKHARASAIDVTASMQAGRLIVEIADDGVGGVDPAGSLGAIRDRVVSVGGRVRVDSPRGAGTRVRAVL